MSYHLIRFTSPSVSRMKIMIVWNIRDENDTNGLFCWDFFKYGGNTEDESYIFNDLPCVKWDRRDDEGSFFSTRILKSLNKFSFLMNCNLNIIRTEHRLTRLQTSAAAQGKKAERRIPFSVLPDKRQAPPSRVPSLLIVSPPRSACEWRSSQY